MKAEQIVNLINAINDMADVAIPNLDAALDIVDNHSKLSELHKKNVDALKKMVVFTKEETEYKQGQANKENEINEGLANSIVEKDKKLLEYEKELLEKDFKIDLKKIDKKHLQDKDGNLLVGIKIKHLAALKPILK